MVSRNVALFVGRNLHFVTTRDMLPVAMSGAATAFRGQNTSRQRSRGGPGQVFQKTDGTILK